MSNLTELTRQVSTLNRSIRDYIFRLEAFNKVNAEQLELIRLQLSGDSSNPHSQRMIACVTSVDEVLKTSFESLSRASLALSRVEML